MKKILLFLFFHTILSSLLAQETYNISKPELSLSDNILTIKYDITGCGNNESVNIRLIVLNSKGDTIKPVYISGDIGKNVKCGIGKSIMWNLEKERIIMIEDISVYVRGEKPVISNSAIKIPEQNKFTRGNIILSSTFVPGLGQSKASGKNCYFVFTGLVYGTLGASIYFSTQSEKYNDDYHAAVGSERDVMYDKWQDSYNKSKYFAIGSAGIWVTNLIWSAVMPINNHSGRKMSMNFIAPNKNEFYLSAKWNF